MPVFDIENRFLLLDQKSCYWLGFLWADGNTRWEETKKRYMVRLSLASIDKQHLEYFRDYVSPNRPIYHRKTNDSYSVEMSNKDLCKTLIDLGIYTDRSSLARSLPDIPAMYWKDFLRGYFDGDGTIGIYSRYDRRVNITYTVVQIRIGFVNEFLPKQIKWQLALDEIESTVCKEKTRNVWYLNISGRKEQIAFIRYLYDNTSVDMRLERKYVCAHQALELLTNQERERGQRRMVPPRGKHCRTTKTRT